MRITLLTLALLSFNADAGMFLDMSIGTHLRSWNGSECSINQVKVDFKDNTYSTNCHYDNNIGSQGMLFLNRLGLETRSYQLGKDIGIKGQVFWEHISDIADSNDSGLDVFAIGFRLTYR